MGGKRASGRSNSGGGGGGHMYPRISSGGSMKSSILESSQKKESGVRTREEQEDDLQEGYSPRKSSFDIISLLENTEDAMTPNSAKNGGRRLHEECGGKGEGSSSETLPSFWHFVQPETTNHRYNELFNQHRTMPLYKTGQNSSIRHKPSNNSHIKNFSGVPPGGINLQSQVPPNKKMMKRRKVKKKVQSAKVAGFKTLERSPDRLQREGIEWLRVLTPPPGTDASTCEADDDDEEDNDELIKRYFSGLSSAGSSISWAEDAMESEFTSQLSKLWEEIENVCAGGIRPEKMSDAVFDECLQWRKAFPNANMHRFTRNEADVSPTESPTFDDDRFDCETGDDAPFSSLVQSSNYYSKVGRKSVNESVNSLQANFRSLNCATPRPNIEKSTEYVSAWLSECQNSSYVPDHHQTHNTLLDYNKSRASSPPLSMRNNHPTSASTLDTFTDDGNEEVRSRHSLRLVSDVARSSYGLFSRSHAKFVSNPNPENFFTSMALSNIESGTQGASSATATDNYGFYQRRIAEYDDDGDVDEDNGDGESPGSSLTEIVSFRQNVKVQRPISSRIRDHTITPLATGYPHPHSSNFGNGVNRMGINANRQTTAATSSASNSHSFSQENQRRGMGMFDGNGMDTITSPTHSAAPSSALNSRTRSGVMRQSHVGYGGGRGAIRQQQAPWSRHTGDDHLTADTNYVTSLYENYQSGSGGGNSSSVVTSGADRGGLRSSNLSGFNGELLRSPTASLKNGFLHFDRTSVFDSGSLLQ